MDTFIKSHFYFFTVILGEGFVGFQHKVSSVKSLFLVSLLPVLKLTTSGYITTQKKSEIHITLCVLNTFTFSLDDGSK